MATSKELLKAQEAGAEIRITIAGQPEGGIVEYSPRHKGDRLAWVYADGSDACRYAAKDVAAVAVAEPEERETPAIKAEPVVTQEMIDALALLRSTAPAMPKGVCNALRTLYAAGVFAHIDAVADAKEAPKNIAARAKEARRESIQRAVGLSQVSADGTVQCGHCRGGYKPKKDGTLRKHGCWRYDLKLKTIVYGELDIHDRAARVADQKRRAAERRQNT